MMHDRAGLRALPEDLVDLDALISAYFEIQPDVSNSSEKVVFGTSGHRGSSLDGAFNEAHILAVTQAIVEYRAAQGVTGPLFVGRDTHGLSEPSWRSVLEVLAGNGVEALVDAQDGFTPTPAVSHAILTHNRQGGRQADGLLLTPSHNPPRDGGIKYNPPSGGPAGSDATSAIAARANELLAHGLADVKRVPFETARKAVGAYDFLGRYVDDLPAVIDIAAIRAARVRIGADPLGGAAVAYWGAIAERHGLNLTVVNEAVDPRWAFMPLDTDGKIRMDCSSSSAMANLIGIMKGGGAYDVATGNDADADRHGIVTPDGGLMNPNHYLAAAISYLFSHRPGWGADTAVGKTLVSSSMIDRVVAGLGRRLLEVPVGFKYFVPGLLD
ncbi:MAG: phosphoglucomutase, alpha-D-glucose phosphate-specific, partial [Caulobacter sp.]